MTVAVNFHPPTLFAAPVPLPPLKHRTDQGRIQSGFQPAEVVAAAFPIHPSAAIASGTVVLEAALSETGKVERTRVLLDLPALTTEAVRAIEDWKLAPAALAGKPVKSKTILAFVFRAPPPPPLSQ
jgi:outer membrane biosynthesis protein TonB